MPKTGQRLLSMSRRQIRFETQANVWLISLYYGLLGFLIVGIAYVLDMRLFIGEHASFFQVDYELTRQIISSLVAGIITLNAFTLNSILVVLTNFSGQFTPRMLLTFIADRKTQHAVGIFNMVFVFILFSFFMINDGTAEYYAAFPTLTILLMFFALATFVFFINHAVKWMQVPNLTFNMKNESEKQILTTLVEDLEPYRTQEPKKEEMELNEDEGTILYAKDSGFIQVIDFKSLFQYAEKKGLIIRLEKRIGEFVLKDIPLLTYWKREDCDVNEAFICSKLFVGRKQTEVQDIEFGVNKLKEIAIKSIGNDDPNTVKNAILQLSDLLLSISEITHFTPYLTDQEGNLRLIINEETFDYYLYSSFSHISIYAKEDPVITNDILHAVSLLASSTSTANHKSVWMFAMMVARGYQAPFAFAYHEKDFYTHLEKISHMTRNYEGYTQLEKELKERLNNPTFA
ncbi:LOW QUALITY PROTEIN: hypothetical protein JCM19038_2139 [Geomicrobium sp. JCM 19038]|nr:LOW QUALITY PROTEIN: hypothetical protein JCM19038_2139 [Geomicrobium sp. JCM 19038]